MREIRNLKVQRCVGIPRRIGIYSPKYEHNVNVRNNAEIIMKIASHAGMVSETK